MDFYSDEYSLADKEMLHGYYKFFYIIKSYQGSQDIDSEFGGRNIICSGIF